MSFERSRESCEIRIENGLVSRLPASVFADASSIAIISDDVVSKLYAGKIKDQLSKIARTHVVTFRHGEKSKNIETASQIASELSDLGLDRRTLLVALGGGVVGDLVGFVASIFKRGVPYVQMPTTLLAQVDSSIGGKTGVDTDWGKNQLGTFYQPRTILIDPSTLDTLPQVELVNGLAEMIKSGVIADGGLFHSIEKIGEPGTEDLKPFIARTCRIKARIVEKDEKEANLRAVLNYGHTVGHAIEASSNFTLSHGKCVVLGMVSEGWIAKEMGIFEKSDCDTQNELLAKIISTFKVSDLDHRKILSFAKLDKKSSGATIRMALPEKIGKMHQDAGSYLIPVTGELFTASLHKNLWEL